MDNSGIMMNNNQIDVRIWDNNFQTWDHGGRTRLVDKDTCHNYWLIYIVE